MIVASVGVSCSAQPTAPSPDSAAQPADTSAASAEPPKSSVPQIEPRLVDPAADPDADGLETARDKCPLRYGVAAGSLESRYPHIQVWLGSLVAVLDWD